MKSCAWTWRASVSRILMMLGLLRGGTRCDAGGKKLRSDELARVSGGAACHAARMLVAGPESNRPAVRRGILSSLRLPISPAGLDPGRACDCVRRNADREDSGGLLDRLTHYCHVHEIANKSWLFKHSNMSSKKRNRARAEANAAAFDSAVAGFQPAGWGKFCSGQAVRGDGSFTLYDRRVTPDWLCWAWCT